MKQLKVLIGKELYHLFNSPTAYIFAAIFLGLNNFFYYNSLFLFNQASLRPYFANFPLTLIFFVSLITMGSFSAEKKSGTIELLLSLPVKKSSVVLAKFLAVLTFFLFTLFFTLPNLAILMAIGSPQIGPIVGSYLATLFLVGLYTSVGIFISLMAKDQIMSFLLTACLLFIFYLVGESFVLERTPAILQTVFNFVSPTNHFSNFTKGVIYPQDIVYFLSLTVFFVYLSIKNLNFGNHGFKI